RAAPGAATAHHPPAGAMAIGAGIRHIESNHTVHGDRGTRHAPAAAVATRASSGARNANHNKLRIRPGDRRQRRGQTQTVEYVDCLHFFGFPYEKITPHTLSIAAQRTGSAL